MYSYVEGSPSASTSTSQLDGWSSLVEPGLRGSALTRMRKKMFSVSADR